MGSADGAVLALKPSHSPCTGAWFCFLFPSQWQADSGKMEHSYCGETELCWLLGIQPHHMFRVSPSHVLQPVTNPTSAGREGWSCPSVLLTLHPFTCIPSPASLHGPAWLCWAQPGPLTSLIVDLVRLLWLLLLLVSLPENTLRSRCWLVQEVLEKYLWKVDFSGFYYICVHQVQLFNVRIK